MEKNLIKQFKKPAHRLITERNDEWYLLSIAQHYGLPTRLLDWTCSGMIALHFATSDTNCYDKDGAIWKVNYSDTHDLLKDNFTKGLRG